MRCGPEPGSTVVDTARTWSLGQFASNAAGSWYVSTVPYAMGVSTRGGFDSIDDGIDTAVYYDWTDGVGCPSHRGDGERRHSRSSAGVRARLPPVTELPLEDRPSSGDTGDGPERP